MPPPDPIQNDTPDPKERNLARRSETSSVGIWVIICLIAIGAAGVYAGSALF